MLNKPTSNNINRWKIIVILPLIALFMWSFNVEEKTAYLNTNNKPFSYLVTPETSNNELKSIEEAFESNKIQLKFTDIKRNTKFQMLQITLKTRKSSANTFVKRMSIKRPDNNVIMAFKLQLDSITSDIILNALDKEDSSTTVFTENGTVIKNIGFTFPSQDSIKKNSFPKKLYILNGKEVSSKIIEAINPDQIATINVLKGSNAREKYGAKGKNGVMEISTKSKNLKVGTSENFKPTFKFTPTNSLSENMPEVPLYILEGKEVSETLLKDLKPNEIKSINVLKNKKAIAKYGRKGENGVIEISIKSSTKHIPKNMLYIVDGKETNTTEDLDPNTIKNITVLKGENATNLYGKKGKDGVIIITTKKVKLRNLK